ncbi:MAG: cell wall metabolism sensor histidine kinase WalK [Defluviitaleaceae bacterium]|nr:cell wall metabolism sensor histidine kinase WalK [Defluviitaleaceae bacterium]
MFKSIFRKQVFMNMTIIVVVFLIMGVVLGSMLRTYFRDIHVTRLKEQSERISISLSERSSPFISDWLILDNQFLDRLSADMEIMARYTGTTFAYVSNNPTSQVDEELVNHPFVRSVLDGNIDIFEGSFALFEGDSLIVGHPVINRFTGHNIGAVLLSIPIDVINQTVNEGMRIPIFGMIIAGIIALVLTYFFSKSISRPIAEMNEVAKLIAQNGDFERRINVKSKDEVGSLAESFNNMATALAEIETTRREFISNISHDLRSPLTSIIGFINAIKDGTVPEDKKDYYLGIVLDECIRLSKLAGDILDISSIQSLSKMEINAERFDINKLIEKTSLQFENRILNKNINFSTIFANHENYVLADFNKIQRVLYNILDNAVKFTPQNGSIKVETAERMGKIYVSVRDSGIGLSESEQSRIFDRFYKADTSRGNDKTGAGLGMSIAKEFLKAHDEKIFINSEEGKGCEFIFTLTNC